MFKINLIKLLSLFLLMFNGFTLVLLILLKMDFISEKLMWEKEDIVWRKFKCLNTNLVKYYINQKKRKLKNKLLKKELFLQQLTWEDSEDK
jgi:hypothetical protein